MDSWWTAADRSTICDQDAFDLTYRKYKQLDASIERMIAVLPMTRLNSHPPAILHQEVRTHARYALCVSSPKSFEGCSQSNYSLITKCCI